MEGPPIAGLHGIKAMLSRLIEVKRTLQPSFAPANAQENPLSPLEILAAKIDELGVLEQNFNTLKQEIIKDMQMLKLQRHFGKTYNVILEEKEHLNFADEKAVIDLLKKEKLLNKTLVPTLETIADLFKNPKISDQQKRALATLATKIKTCNLKILKDIE